MMTNKVFGILSLLLLSAALIAVSCSRRPDGVLDKESMARLLADIHKGESVVDVNPRSFADDSTKRAFKQSIYAKHGVTSEQVDSSMMWYGYNMEQYIEVYDRVLELLDDELVLAQEAAGASSTGLADMSMAFEGDSVDVWPGVRYRRLAATMPSEFISFGMASDRYWERGDVYTLRAKALDVHGPLDVVLGVDYSDGSKEYIHRTMSGDGWHDIVFALDSAKMAQQVYGTIHYAPQVHEVAFVDSISLMRTRIAPHNRNAREGVQLFRNRQREK